MRAPAAVAAGILVMGQGSAGLTGQLRPPADSLRTLQSWISAIASHEPAADDAAVAAMQAIPAADLEAAFPSMVAVLKGAAGPSVSLKWDPLFRAHAARAVARPQADRIQSLSGTVAAFGLDRFLRHAALLHSDLGVLAPESHGSFSYGGSQIVQDGVIMQDAPRPLHWILARALLYTVSGSAEDPAVLLWYQAVATHLWSTRTLVEAEPHIRRALEIFPRDGELHFARGLVHESLSAPYVRAAIQAQVDALPIREGFVRVIESAAAERRKAREAFQAAVDADEGHVEARIRLGRVLSLQGNHAQAVRELRAALQRTELSTLRYFGHLFLGGASEAAGRLDDAAAAYEAAAAAFPTAQSPRLSLSRLALHRGDAQSARGAIARLSRPLEQDEDPWWIYHSERQPHRDVWMARARLALTGTAR